MPSAKKSCLSGMEAFSKAGGCRWKEGGGSLVTPGQRKTGGANWNLQNSSVERSPGGTISAIRRIK